MSTYYVLKDFLIRKKFKFMLPHLQLNGSGQVILTLTSASSHVNGALGGVAQWIEHQPTNQRVAGSIPSQGT